MNTLNTFGRFFVGRLADAGYKPVHRGNDLYWRKPGERNTLYDTSEATVQLIQTGEMRGVSSKNS